MNLNPLSFGQMTALSPTTSGKSRTQGLTPTPRMANCDALTFSGAAKNSILSIMMKEKIAGQEQGLKEFLNRTLFADITGLTVLQALEEDLAEHKDKDGEVQISAFLKRLGIPEDHSHANVIKDFLTQAKEHKLLGTPTDRAYIKCSSLGQWIATNPDALGGNPSRSFL